MQTEYNTYCLELNNFFLKKLERVIVPMLTKLIIKYIDESFPPCLKEAIIVAIHENCDVQEPFKTVFSTPDCCKIL